MPDDQTPSSPAAPAATGTPAADPIQNLKAEFTRKLDNQASQLAQLTQLLQSKLQPTDHRTGQPISQSTEEPNLSDVWYKDENKAAEIIERRAEQRILSKLEKQSQEVASRQQVAMQIYKDYPEAQDVTHPLTVKANEIYMSYSEEERRSPSAMKLAVKEAALELGVKPKAKRDAESDSVDSFSLNSGGYQPPRRQAPDTLSKESLDIARNFGMNVDDPAVLEKLKARAKKLNS